METITRWDRISAHVIVLLRILYEKVVIFAILTAVIIILMRYWRTEALTWENIVAVAVAVAGAFMVNCYMQFSRYRDMTPGGLPSDKATTPEELRTRLYEEYHVTNMMKPKK
ncbi:hypothetical protein WJT86_09560 [Microvirga sp. W0021]|uniref:Uncharacterized protein n=1 Tax=Hohaiivirga grylli TaxID=3133970 RepID=A0ABV0BJY2_9HYPH